MVAKRIGHAGLVGWRARGRKKGAKWLGQNTPLDTETLTMLVGIYLFASRTRRMAQMLSRLRGSHVDGIGAAMSIGAGVGFARPSP